MNERKRSHRTRGLGAVTVVLLVAAGVSVGRVDQAAAAGATVSMVGTQFVPPVVDIKTGETVTWENDEPANYPVVIGVHNIVSDDGAFSPSPPVNPGEAWTYSFKKPGAFKYHCGIHPNQMRGTVNVTGDPVPESSTSTAPGSGSTTPTTAPGGGGGGGSTGSGPQGGAGETVRRVELTVAEKDFPVLGVPMTWWTYNGTVPGTTIRANVGDTVEIVLKNTHNLPHAIHTHFMDYDITSDGSSMTAPLPVVPHQEDDTVGAVGGVVPGVAGETGPAIGQNPIGPYEPRGDRDVAGPGKTYTYRYKLDEAGTSWYHCHVLEATDHISKGLYGFI
ncbi:MAG: multicopper oxidase domain-containing protein, partial [Actinobacteria bacterium]|nr:multicopper oxidase domain-containing protein [Actinomycetota bacterium]